MIFSDGCVAPGETFFLFFVVDLFCFVSFLEKNIKEAFCSINLSGNNVTFDSKPKKAQMHLIPNLRLPLVIIYKFGSNSKAYDPGLLMPPYSLTG